MAAFLARALKLKPGDAGFKDTAGHIFEADIAALASAGVTRGCNPPVNDRFCPDQPVTRGQMAAFLYRGSKTVVSGGNQGDGRDGTDNTGHDDDQGKGGSGEDDGANQGGNGGPAPKVTTSSLPSTDVGFRV